MTPVLGAVTWYLARSTGIVAALMLAASLLWGVFLSTKLLQDQKRPAWLLDLHRWLGALTLFFVGLHLLALLLDRYVHFDLRSVLVPFASTWRPLAVTWGVLALYLLVLVQVSSWARRRLSRRLWHGIHLLSYPLVWLVAIHAGSSGTDVGNPLYRLGALVVIAWLLLTVLYRVLASTRRTRTARASAVTANPSRRR